MAGQYYDAETGLHYNYHRFYDPSIGRYLRPDPIGLRGGVNLYAYVRNNPINFIDPTGEIAVTGTLLLIWGGVEFGLSIYDAYTTGSTLLDPCASVSEKGGALGGLALGMIIPGGGYAAGGKVIFKGKKITKELEGRLGIDRRRLGKAIEKIKSKAGRGGKDNIVIDDKGNVIDSNNEIIGNVYDEHVK